MSADPRRKSKYGRVSKPSQHLRDYVGEEMSKTRRRTRQVQRPLPNQDPVKAPELFSPVQLDLGAQPQDAFGDQLVALCTSAPLRTASEQTETDDSTPPARCATEGSMDLDALKFVEGVFVKTSSGLLDMDVSRASSAGSAGSGPICILKANGFGL
jgi:hypothetical protein